jgi:hypothetical protein
MQWVVQQNLLSPVTFEALRQALEARGVAYTAVNLIPFLNVLAPDVELGPGPVYVYGSTGLKTVAREKGWAPGYLDANLDYPLYLQHYGDQMLNHDAVVAPLGQLEKQWERFFLRPTLDSKQFAGEVMTWEALVAFRDGVRSVQDAEGVTLTLEDMVVMAPCKQIHAEYRFFVFDGEIATGSLYKQGDTVRASAEVPAHVLDYARAQVARWQPDRAFAIDVAETGYGMKILELNSANSAGLYACDPGRIVDAVALLAA